jgi:muramoyltetrapeptide carboxypeptidase
VSPSWGGPAHLPDRYQRGLQALQNLGYNVRVMPHAVGNSSGSRPWLSADRESRLSDLHAAFADPSVDAILASIGGNHSTQLVDGLNFTLITDNPKPICGYSDITVLLHAIHARTGLVTFYGPALIPEFGEYGGPDAQVVEHWQQVLGRPEPAGPVPRTDWQETEFRGDSDIERRPRHRVAGEPRTVLRAGTGDGRLLAGCLPSIRNLVGTRWQPEFAGRLLVLETPEAPYDVEWADADIAHLWLAGAFDNLGGLVVGRTDGWTPTQVEQLHECVLDAVRDTKYPVLAGLECTHSAPLMTLPIGVHAVIEGDDLVITEPAVS